MYYTIVLVIAIILLIISLSVIGVTLTSGSNKKNFPEFHDTCPDYWTLTTDGDNIVCTPPSSGINTPDQLAYVGNSHTVTHAGVTAVKNSSNKWSITKLDLSSSNWMSICDKSSWAKKNKLVWDGVSNNNTC
jgi:hypothetical protein